jgi:hypothetical protein
MKQESHPGMRVALRVGWTDTVLVYFVNIIFFASLKLPAVSM